MVQAVILDACPLCAGVYFDEGEIAALQRGGPEALESAEDEFSSTGLVLVDCEAPKRCPGCGDLMCVYTYRYSSDIRLDGCDRCGGVWVQDGELARIAEHLRAPGPSSGGTAPAHREAASQNATIRHALTLRTALASVHGLG